jgi:Helitron helicase-like domain at N-terminus
MGQSFKQSSPADVSLIICRGFNMVCQDIIKNLSKVFGRVAAHVYVIEFQKRGLPHMHLLATLARP